MAFTQMLAHQTPSDPQPLLRSAVYKETRRNHRHDLDVSNAQPNEEPACAFLTPDVSSDLGHAQTVPVPDHTAHLHPPPDDFERIGYRLGNEACEPAGSELGPGAEAQDRFVGSRL